MGQEGKVDRGSRIKWRAGIAIAVVELSQKTWLVGGIIPGINRHPVSWGIQPTAGSSG
jgi:hypothetical protein